MMAWLIFYNNSFFILGALATLKIPPIYPFIKQQAVEEYSSCSDFQALSFPPPSARGQAPAGIHSLNSIFIYKANRPPPTRG
jgi:hypothetical protein